MGFLASPIGSQIVGAGIGLGSKLFSGGGGASASSANSQALTEGLTQARQANAQGTSLFNTGAPLLQSAGNFWNKLLSGDTKTVGTAIAPQRAGLEENYLGAERGLAAGPLRGGARDYAAAELARDKAGKIGMLAPTAINAAAGQAGSLGLQAASAGASATQGAAGLFGSLYGNTERAREFDIGQHNATGEQIGTFISTLLSGLAKNPAGKKPTSPATIGGGSVTGTGAPGLIAGRTPGYAQPTSYAGINF